MTVSGLLVLAACSTPAAYAPREPGKSVGYSDERLAQNRYRVTFTGNSATPRDTVEDFLLLRSAEVTRDAGYGYFAFDTRDTQTKTTYHTDFAGWPGWRGRGWYWHSWAFGPPYDEDYDTFPITRYEAYAEIVMLTPEQAAKNPRALEAGDIIAHLGPKAVPPPKT